MAISQDELTSIVNAVLSALRTNSKSIMQLTPSDGVEADDWIEINGGRRISYATLRDAIGGGVGGDVSEEDIEKVVMALTGIRLFNAIVDKKDELYSLGGAGEGYVAFVKEEGQFYMRSGQWSECYQNPKNQRPITSFLYQLDNTLYQVSYNTSVGKSELKEYGLSSEELKNAIDKALESIALSDYVKKNELPSPDWDAAEGEPGYIRNKPFGEDARSYIQLIPEATTESDGVYSASAPTEGEDMIEPGKAYMVSFGQTVKNVRCVAIKGDDDDAVACLTDSERFDIDEPLNGGGHWAIQLRKVEIPESGGLSIASLAIYADFDFSGFAVNVRKVTERTIDGNFLPIEQKPGEAEDKLMSQKAVTDMLAALPTQAAVDAAALKVFNDRWNAACGSYGGYKPDEAPDKSKPYVLNDMWFSYSEALLIDRESMPIFWQMPNSHARIQSRTLYPLHSTGGSYGITGTFGAEFASAPNLEVVRFLDGYNYISISTFLRDTKLREIRGGYIAIRNANGGIWFSDCIELEIVDAWNVNCNVSFQNCPKLTYSTIAALVKGCINTSTISIVLHPDIYAALTGEASYPFNGGTQEQWAQILTDAAQKQVSFGTI